MTWRHPSITYGAVEPESASPPPGRRRAAGWAATIIGVGLAASALSLALGGGGLALKAAAALVLELRTRPSSHHPPKRHDERHVGYCCTAESVAPGGARIGTRGHVCDACVVDNSLPVQCHSRKKCQRPECGSGRFCVGTYKGDVQPPPLPGGTTDPVTDGVAEVETTDALTCRPSDCDPPCAHPAECGHRFHGDCTCLEPPGGVEEPGAGSTMMSMNSVAFEPKKFKECMEACEKKSETEWSRVGMIVQASFIMSRSSQANTGAMHLEEGDLSPRVLGL